MDGASAVPVSKRLLLSFACRVLVEPKTVWRRSGETAPRGSREPKCAQGGLIVRVYLPQGYNAYFFAAVKL